MSRLTQEEFILQAIVRLRSPGAKFKGIHTVYSGFNEAFRTYFPGEDPIIWTKKLEGEGKIVIRTVRGGVMLYLPDEAPAPKTRGADALKKMGLE